MELRDYLKLEDESIPWRYVDAIYEQLEKEMEYELRHDNISIYSESVWAYENRYNTKWNQIVNEYQSIYGKPYPPLREDYFKDTYAWKISKPYCSPVN